jgi:hypothetical protein
MEIAVRGDKWLFQPVERMEKHHAVSASAYCGENATL